MYLLQYQYPLRIIIVIDFNFTRIIVLSFLTTTTSRVVTVSTRGYTTASPARHARFCSAVAPPGDRPTTSFVGLLLPTAALANYFRGDRRLLMFFYLKLFLYSGKLFDMAILFVLISLHKNYFLVFCCHGWPPVKHKTLRGRDVISRFGGSCKIDLFFFHEIWDPPT